MLRREDGRVDDIDEEDRIPVLILRPLLLFEEDTTGRSSADVDDRADESPLAAAWREKERGNALYWEGDATAASERYERALASIVGRSSPTIGLGSTVAVRRSTRNESSSIIALAEVDCIDEDDEERTTLDVTYVDATTGEPTGEEGILAVSDVWMRIIHDDDESKENHDDKDDESEENLDDDETDEGTNSWGGEVEDLCRHRIQERLLLNLSRCLLRLADDDSKLGQRRLPGAEYRDSAEDACTLALMMMMRVRTSTTTTMMTTARLLRARARIGRHRYEEATKDL